MVDFTQHLGSLAAIVTAAVFLTGAAKQLLSGVAGLRDIPTWLYTATIAVAFVLLGVSTGALDPAGMPVWKLVINGALNGALASGLREWVVKARTTLEESDDSNARKRRDGGAWMGMLLVVTMGMSAGACASLGSVQDVGTSVRGEAAQAARVIEAVAVIAHDGLSVAIDLRDRGIVAPAVVVSIREAILRTGPVLRSALAGLKAAGRVEDVARYAKEAAEQVRELARVFRGKITSLPGVSDALEGLAGSLDGKVIA